VTVSPSSAAATGSFRTFITAGRKTFSRRAHGPEDTNYEPEDMNNEEIERAAKLSVRKSAALEYYCASASGLDVAGLGNGTLTSDERIRRKFEEQ